ncbi:hypothetical protein [Oceanobacillus limi]|nr:hypothetical protein [Oceanobacillus limi]
MAHFRSLGLTDEMVYSISIFFGIIGIYFVTKPVISFLIALNSTKLLCYVISSLIFIVAFFVVVLIIGEIRGLTLQLVKFSLQALGVFGGALWVIHVFNYLRRKRI